MPSIDDAVLADLGHRNYLEFSRELARGAGRRGAVHEEDGLLLFAAGSTFPVLFNGVWRTDPTVPGTEVVERADAWFAARARGYTISVRDGYDEEADLRDAAEAAGLLEVLNQPEMICRARVEDRALPDGAELRWVEDRTTFDDFLTVNDAAYQSLGMPARSILDAGFQLEHFAVPQVLSVVAYLDGGPVAAAQTVLSHGAAGIYWVGTVEAARGTGLGDAVARAVTNRAFDEGARCNSLQASSMGEAIYRRMGYETLYRYTSFVRFV